MDGGVMNAPIERKVTAATGGSAAGVAVAGAVLWLLDSVVFKAGPVPDPIVVLVWAVVPAALTFLGGYLARHTPRNDPAAIAGDHRVEKLADESVRMTDQKHRRLRGR